VRRPGPLGLIAAAGAAASAAAWGGQLLRDRRRVQADPAHARLSAPLAGRRLPVTAPDGTGLHAEVFGPRDGAPIVLVHGWTCQLRFWTLQIQQLAADGFRVIAYDLRGHGRSGRPEHRDYSIDAHADDLAAVLDAALAEDERAIVAGHSLGGMTLVAYAGRHPEDLRRRVVAAALVNTGMGDLISESFVLRAPAPLDELRTAIGRLALSAQAPLPKRTTPISHRVVRYVALSPEASPAEVAFCEAIALDCHRDARAACGGTLTELDLHHAVEALRVPTVVIAARRDRLTPPAHAERLAAALPELTELVVLEGSGHMSPVTDAERVTTLIAGLARTPAPAAPTQEDIA
jgi:pimeloyl-ACP methyl ester carboxylesterase